MNPLEQLLALFESAAGLVEKELLQALSRDAKSTARERSRRLAEIRAILAELRSKAIGTADSPGLAFEVIREGYRKGLQGAAESVAGAGDEGVGRDLGGIHLDAVRALYVSLSDDLEQATLYVEKASNRTLRKVALNEVLVGQIAGRSQARNAEAIAENLKSRGVKGFRDRAGREWSLPVYARMAAATTAVEAQTTAALNRYAEAGIDLVRWMARPTVEKNEPCERCQARDGKVYSITGTTAGYALLEEAPPLHPLCGCVLVAYIEMGVGSLA